MVAAPGGAHQHQGWGIAEHRVQGGLERFGVDGLKTLQVVFGRCDHAGHHEVAGYNFR